VVRLHFSRTWSDSVLAVQIAWLLAGLV